MPWNDGMEKERSKEEPQASRRKIRKQIICNPETGSQLQYTITLR